MDSFLKLTEWGSACLGGTRAGRWVPSGGGAPAGIRLDGGPQNLSLHSEAVFWLISLLAFSWGCSGAPMTLDLFMPLTLPGIRVS